MDEKMIQQQLAEAEQYSEKVKAEFYISLGKIASLKELLAKMAKKEEKKDAV